MINGPDTLGRLLGARAGREGVRSVVNFRYHLQEGNFYLEEEPESRHVESALRRSERALASDRRM
jgi:hypothetical protein